MMRHAAAAAAVLVLLGASRVAAEELPDLADRVQASVVSIAIEAQSPASTPSDKDQNADAKPNVRQGSGMVMTPDGYVITATGLVDKPGKITIVYSDGKQAPAQIMGRDPRTGIALLKAAGASGLTPIHFGDAHQVRRGTSVFSIGNAYSLQSSLSAGVISAIRRAGGSLPHLVLQTDIVVQPDSIGAPLFNMKGEVIGMFASNYSNAGKPTGIAFAITSNVLKDVAEKLQKSRVIDRGWLGVQVRKITDDEATALALEKGGGLAVIKVTDGAPAAGAGLTAGDVITSFNGQPVRDIVAFAWAVANQPSSSDATLGIARESGRSDLHLKLGRLPDTPPATSSTQPSSSGPATTKD